MSEIQWGSLKQPDYLGGALQAQTAGRQQASINALRGYQTDPQGTIGALIAGGDVQSAGALANLQYQQSQRDLLTQGAQKFFGGGSAPQPMASGAAQGQPSPAAPADPAAQAQPDAPLDPAKIAQAGQRLETFDTTAQLLQSLPYAQRKAALATATPNLINNGLAQDAISSFDPSDQNLEAFREQIAQAHNQIGTQPSGAQPAPAIASGQPDPQQAPPSATVAPAQTATAAAPPSAGMNIYDPDTQKALGLMTMGSPQIGGALPQLATATAPSFGGGERPGAPIMDKHTGKIIGFAPTADGLQIVSDGQGGWTTQTIPGYADAAAKYQATLKGATTHAEHSAAAPYEMVTLEQPDGSKVQMTMDQFKALKASGHMPSLGVSQTPGSAKAQELDGENYAKEVDAHGVGAITSSQNARTITEQALKLAQGINPNAWTSNVGKIDNQLNAMGFKVAAGGANDISTYKALLPQVLRGTFTTFPRLEKEFEIVQKAAANVDTPKDAAQILLATQAAIQGRNLAYSNFVNDYQGPSSKQALTKAFMASPQAQTSIFADPIWRGMQIGGKPAVMVGDKPLPNGHIYGVFRPGTPYAQTFMVQ